MYRRDKQARLLTGGLVGALPVTTPGDEHWDDVTLLLDGSSPTTDVSSVGNTITNDHGVSVTSTVGPYGKTQDVLEFDGSNDDLWFDVSTDMELVGDFTIETWMKRDIIERQSVVNYWGTSSDARFNLDFDRTSGSVTFTYDTGPSGNAHRNFSYSGTSAAGTANWFHLAVTRSGTDLKCFIDGTQIGTTQTISTTTFVGNSTYSNKAYIGSLAGVQNYFDGQMADFRLTKGVARYTSNFTPPTASLPTNAPVVGRRGVGSVDSGSPLITNAADFDDTADYMHWTPASDGDLLKWTLSFWGKQSGGRWVMWGAGSAVSDLVYLDLLSDLFSVVWIDNSGGTQKLRSTTTTPMTDWTHVVVSLDAANATTSERMKIYLNGVEPSYSTDSRSTLSSSSTLSANSNVRHTICADYDLSKSATHDGTLADIHFIDGQVLTASDFGEDVSGTWSAKAYSGTYGSNGYHLDFTDGANLGSDSSGNGNDWTEVSLTAVDNQVAVTTSDIPQVIPAATATLRTRGYVGAAPAGGGMLTLYDVYAQKFAPPPLIINYLVIAGGGGGGNNAGAGGGAGGYRSSVFGESSGGGANAESPIIGTVGTNYTVTVGAGGGGAAIANGSRYNGADGGASVFDTITTTGGGGGSAGGSGPSTFYGRPGGSGGGGSNNSTTPSSASARAGGTGTSEQGYAGGAGNAATGINSGGGGGAGGAGASGGSGNSGGLGGAGVSSSITGAAVTRASGGSAAYTTGATPGGGGAGGQNGTANTGGGGGFNGNGGSGVVILRYPSEYTITAGGNLTLSTITVDSDKVTTFTDGSDSVSFTLA